MSDILEKFSVFSEISEQFKQNIKLFHIFNGNNVLIVTNDDKVFAFGSNSNGKCGFGHNNRVVTPQEIPELNGKQIKQFFIGEDFVLALNENNHVFGWGNNGYGQLGRGYISGRVEYLKPALISDLENIIEISCGDNHSLAVDEQNNVFSWGTNGYGQVGCGEESFPIITRPVQLEELPKIKSIHCYIKKSFAVTFDGLVYSWGDNRKHCLGYKSREIIYEPELICGLNNVISVGSSVFNTYFLTNEGNIQFCGENDSRDYQFEPKIIETDLKFQSLHTIYPNYPKVLALNEETVYCLERNSIQKTKYKSVFDYCLHEMDITSETLQIPVFIEYLILGSGNFGNVYKWFNKNDHKNYALKIIQYQAEKMFRYKREVEILSICDEKYVVKYYESWINKEQFYIQMELCDNNLKNIIQEKRKCFERQSTDEMSLTEYFICSHLMKEIVECVQYLNQNNIIHRDLKPENILVNYEPKNGRFVKLCDFGISVLESNQTISHTRGVGTTKYMAPEVLGFEGKNELRVKYNTNADIYSLGKIFSDLIDFDINSPKLENKLGILIEKMLTLEHENRPDCKFILNKLLDIINSIYMEMKEQTNMKIKEFKNQFFWNYFKQKLNEYEVDEQIEAISETINETTVHDSQSSDEELTLDLISNDSDIDSSDNSNEWLTTVDDKSDDTENTNIIRELESEKQSVDYILGQIFPNIFKNNDFINIFADWRGENVFIVTNDDKVFAFGSNYYEQCGFGHRNRADKPQEIPELNGKQIKQFFIGLNFVLALNGNNHVFGWGWNDDGQLGRGYSSKEYLKPALIPDLENIIEISCGSVHSLALDEQNNVFSWGANRYGQVGCGSGLIITRPVQLEELPKIKSIHCYIKKSFAVTFDGLLYSWGYNEYHCLGHKSQEEKIFKPKLICGLNNVISVGSSVINTYFLTNEGNILFSGLINLKEDQLIPKILETDLKFQSIQTINLKVLALSEETVYYLERNSIKATNRTFYNCFLNENQNISMVNLKLKLLKTFERYEKLCELGSGFFGTVIKAKDKLNGNIYALKISKEREYNEGIKKEAKLLYKCNDKFVVKYYNIGVQEDKLFLKMELCDTNLDKIIEEKGKCFERQSTDEMSLTEYLICSHLMKEILECVQHLHQMKPPIIHRDLNPRNILINYEPRNGRFLKLADFGISTLGSDKTISHTRWKGTPEYTAPEVWNGEIGTSGPLRVRYSTKADVYSLGKILCELFGLDINSSDMKNNELTHQWNELVKLTKKMLDNKYQNRPSCEKILVSHNLWSIEKITEKDKNSEEYQKSVKQMEEFENKFFINFFGEKQKIESVLNSVNNERKDKNESLKRSANEFEQENKKQKIGESVSENKF